MFWRLHHTTVLPCTLQEAYDLCINLDNFVPLQSIVCKDFHFFQQPDSSKNPPPLTASKDGLLKMLNGQTRPDVPWSSLHDKAADPHAMFFDFLDSGARLIRVSGSQFVYKDLNLLLYHTIVDYFKIEQWKMRYVYEEDGKVRVTETVWGDVPAIVAWPMLAFDVPQKVHTKHMESYHTLLPPKKT